MNYPPGFVPVQFNKVGKIMMVLGLLGLAFCAYYFFVNTNAIFSTVLIFSVLFILVGLYLAKATPRDKNYKKDN